MFIFSCRALERSMPSGVQLLGWHLSMIQTMHYDTLLTLSQKNGELFSVCMSQTYPSDSCSKDYNPGFWVLKIYIATVTMIVRSEKTEWVLIQTTTVSAVLVLKCSGLVAMFVLCQVCRTNALGYGFMYDIHAQGLIVRDDWHLGFPLHISGSQYLLQLSI